MVFGAKVPFQDFAEFQRKIEGCSLGAKELVQMKRNGIYLASQLNYQGVRFETIEVMVKY